MQKDTKYCIRCRKRVAGDCGQPERDVERMVVMGARIEEHPILGKQEKGRLVTFYFF